MGRRGFVHLWVGCALLLLAGCANTDDPGVDGPVVQHDVGPPDGVKPPLDWSLVQPTITGRVLAPEGTIPISGALVYAAAPSKPPAPIPDKVYCDTCVKLEATTPHTLSKADGSFELKLPLAGDWLLVTQKGAFRRVRPIKVPEAGLAIDKATTTLPRKTDASLGDTIPKMLVLRGAWDAIENSLAKLGLGDVDSNGSLKAGTESFTMADCKVISILPPRVDCKPEHPMKYLEDATLLSQYQILFVPCDSDWLDFTFASAKAKSVLLQWIKDGGRIYVTDYQYDLLTKILPDYIEWEGQSSQMGSAELTSSYDAPAIVNDQGLKDWLAGQGITTFQLQESYTIIKTLKKVATPHPDQPGKSFYETPKAWVSGDVSGYGVRPMTVSFHYGCGRALFSSYHTEGDKSIGTKLLPQELALLYIVLEVAVCIEPPKID